MTEIVNINTMHEIAVWLAFGWICLIIGYTIQLFFNIRHRIKEDRKLGS